MTYDRERSKKFLKALKEKILSGEEITAEEAGICMFEIPTEELCAASHEITVKCAPKKADLCSIINIKSGRCTEDCKWCAQSRLYKTDTPEYPLKEADECIKAAADCYLKGIDSFSAVASGRKISAADLKKLTGICSKIREEVPISICASLGLLHKEELQQLKQSGVDRYHCNLESSPSFFKEVCSSHSIEDKLQTLRYAKEAGLKICTGGIIGMGESMQDRLELGLALRKTGTDSVPLNVLNPIKGTPLEGREIISAEELLRTVAVWRLLMPEVYIRFAGGRINISRELQQQCLYAGVNAAITGDMLTTLGTDTQSDRKMFCEAGYELKSAPAEDIKVKKAAE